MNYFTFLFFIFLVIKYDADFSFFNTKDDHQKDTIIVEDSIYLTSINDQINLWLDDLNLTLGTIKDKVDSLGILYQETYGIYSLSYALITHKKGVVKYYEGLEGSQQAFRQAIEYYKEALECRIRIKANYDINLTPDILRGYNNIGSCFLELNEPYKAMEYFEKALAIDDLYLEIDKDLYYLILDLNFYIAQTFVRLGDYDNAINYFDKIINDDNTQTTEDVSDKVKALKVLALNDCGSLYANLLYDPVTAREYLLEAREIMDLYEISEDIINRAINYSNLGLVLYRLEKYDSAIAYFKKSLDINTKLENKNGMADNCVNLAASYNKLKQLDSSLFHLNEARKLYNILGRKYDLWRVYDNYADRAASQDDHIKSIKYHNLALTYLVKGFNPKTLFSNPDLNNNIIANKEGLIFSLNAKAKVLSHIYQKNGDLKFLKSAYETFQLADKVIGLMRQEFQAEASRMSLAKYSKPIYEGAIEACYHLFHISNQDSLLDKAFEYSEKSRAIVLLDAVRKTNASATVDPQLIRAERDMNLKVNYFEKQATIQEQDENKKAFYNVYDSLLYYRRQRQAVIEQIREQTPEYYNLIFEQSATTPQKLRSFLREDQSLIEYFVGDSSLYTFVIKEKNALFFRNNNPDSVKQWTSQLLHNVRQKDQNFLLPAKKLYDQLITPINEMARLSNQLVFVPDDVLGLINFEMLVTKHPQSERIYFPEFKDYLLYDHRVSYAFSATTLMETHKKPRTLERTFLGIAPLFDKGFTVDGTFFDKLDENIDEVEQISTLYNNLILAREQANKEAFFEFASDYSIIHFATHAKANNSNGDLSFIAFGAGEKDFLYAKDLYALNLNADVVVLSACQTSQGSLNRGEGIISLARGFIYAGASSVVTSLWNVREGTNKTIIKEFYQGLENGLPKDMALRDSKINFLNSISRENQELAHPYYWATLVCMGDTASYQKNSSSKELLLLLIALILIPGSFILYKKFRGYVFCLTG